MSWLYGTILLVLVGQTFGKPAVRVRVTQKGLDYGMFVKCVPYGLGHREFEFALVSTLPFLDETTTF
jgi:hypothetical protein